MRNQRSGGKEYAQMKLLKYLDEHMPVKALILAAVVLVFILAILVGPLNVFAHGFQSRVMKYAEIMPEEYAGTVDLTQQEYSLTFTPNKPYFTGFALNVIFDPADAEGELVLTVSDQNGNAVDQQIAEIRRMHSAKWYYISGVRSLKENTTYQLRISARNVQNPLLIPRVQEHYVSEESSHDNLLIGYVYKEATFTPQQRVLIVMLLLTVAVMLCSLLISNFGIALQIRRGTGLCLLFILLSWNYMYNIMDTANETFDYFQEDSEALAIGAVMAESRGIQGSKYGLYSYSDVAGSLLSRVPAFVSDENWTEGYSNAAPVIQIPVSDYTYTVKDTWKTVCFANGDELTILNTETEGDYIRLYLQSEEPLSRRENGSLANIRFRDAEQNWLHQASAGAYTAQYGLQGKLFAGLSHWFSLDDLRLMCSVAAAAVLFGICCLIAVKYNKLFAGIYYITVLLSPWIVNFSNNLYWVSATWFLPTAVGLLCSINIHRKGMRYFCYLGAFVTIAIKSLCGYEYMSTIMMGLIIFLLIDLVAAVLDHDYQMQWLLLKTTVAIGIAAVLGFGVAMCIHGFIRGNGDVVVGVKTIILSDVLRRTYTIDYNMHSHESLMSSAWQVLGKYFRFDTQIITGVPGNLFPVLCLAPVAVSAAKIGTEEDRKYRQLVALYIVNFLATISWLVLAKGHSDVHTHMNYVLWYFGFVQTCFYILVTAFLDLVNKKKPQQ